MMKATNPYEPPKKPSLGEPPGRFFKSYFTRAHLWVFAVIWGGFTVLTFLIVNAGADQGGGRLFVIALTTAATISGPMTGAVARDFQSCCFEFSLSLLPYCGAILFVGVAAQLVKWPFQLFAGAIRMFLWIVGWIGWFMGGIVSFAHALC
jgi:hypothetical protein